METRTNPIQLVEQEQVPSFRFGTEDVLAAAEARQQRMRDVTRATALGNSYQGK